MKTLANIITLGLFLTACATSPSGTAPLPSAVVNSQTPSPNSLVGSPQQLVTPQMISASANGVQMVAGNWRLTSAQPDKDVLQTDVCFQTPDDAEWFIQEATLTFNSSTFSQIVSQAQPENLLPLATAPKRCATLEFRVPANTPTAALTLSVAAMQMLPTFEQICGEAMPAVQKILDERTPGVKTKCELTELGYTAEVTHKPETVTLGEAQRAFEQARREAYPQLFSVRGPWTFTLNNATLPRTVKPSLRDANAPSPAVTFAVQNIRRYPFVVLMDVCIQAPNDFAWHQPELVLEYANREVWLNSPLTPSAANCQTFSAEVPAEADLTQAQVKLYTLPSATPQNCDTYVPQLQAALDKHNWGINVACDVQPSFWQLKVTQKPAAMSEREALELVMTNDLTALKGLWIQTISVPALPATSLPKVDEPHIVAIDHLNVRSGPSTDNAMVGELLGGDQVRVLAQKDGWWQIDYGQPGGWVFGAVVEFVGDKTAVSINGD